MGSVLNTRLMQSFKFGKNILKERGTVFHLSAYFFMLLLMVVFIDNIIFLKGPDREALSQWQGKGAGAIGPICPCLCMVSIGGQIAERLGNRAINQKVASLILGRANVVVSLGKEFHPTCLGGNVPVTVSLSG